MPINVHAPQIPDYYYTRVLLFHINNIPWLANVNGWQSISPLCFIDGPPHFIHSQVPWDAESLQ